MNRLARKVRDVAERELGGIGPSFITKQIQRLSLDEEELSADDLSALATEASSNCLLLVGKVRAQNLRTAISELAEAA